MRSNVWKRIGAVALAIAVSLTMGVTSFAASTTDEPNATGGISSTDTALNIPKGIIVEGTLDQVYGPTVTYAYTIAPAKIADGTSINDGTTTVGVKAGVAGGVTLANDGMVVFTSSEVNVGEIKANLVANVDTTKFSLPGVYRYEIKDTTATSALYNAGITRPEGYDTTRYLDVYIRNSDSGLQVYGYVLQAENAKSTTKDSVKSQGFVDASEKVTDLYKTVNVKFGKKITGTMADPNHQFPFTVTVNNDGHSYYAKVNADPTVSDDTSETTAAVDLSNDMSYYMIGLSPRATITYTETNDTTETYTVTVTAVGDGGSTTIVDGDSTVPGATQTTGTQNVSDYTTVNSSTDVSKEATPTAYSVITFTNNLEAISPTNVVMRFAPFLFIFGAAILLLVVMRKRRTHSAE